MDELIDQKPEDWRFKMYHTNRMDRVRHYFVDGFVVFVLTMILGGKLASYFHLYLISKNTQLIFFCLFSIIYYVFFEYFFQATPGKFINAVKVVNANGNKPGFLQIIYRSAIRLLPITFILLFLPDKLTLHDMLSQTFTVRKPKLKSQNDKAEF